MSCLRQCFWLTFWSFGNVLQWNVHARTHTTNDTQHNECGKTKFGIGSKRSGKKQQNWKYTWPKFSWKWTNEHVRMMFFFFHFIFVLFFSFVGMISLLLRKMELMLIYIVDKRCVPLFLPLSLRSNEMEKKKKWREKKTPKKWKQITRKGWLLYENREKHGIDCVHQQWNCYDGKYVHIARVYRCAYSAPFAIVKMCDFCALNSNSLKFICCKISKIFFCHFECGALDCIYRFCTNVAKRRKNNIWASARTNTRTLAHNKMKNFEAREAWRNFHNKTSLKHVSLFLCRTK